MLDSLGRETASAEMALLALKLTLLAENVMLGVQLMAPQSGNGVIGPRAVLKVLLHSAKHPHLQVMGLLMGPKVRAS